ncbi:MAG TPA: glutathione S-transferase family protein [Xanthobacteraceae bacterium]|nr:glutathione S-transferase family protein [Xanthobacteraceae bacterium]
MRLFYSVGSPYARVVRIALLETGLDGRVNKIEVPRARLYSSESEVLTINPTGRVPTLELDGGAVLTESQLILNYLNAVSPSSGLLPCDGSDGWQTLAEMGQAWGLLDSIVAWVRARQPPESPHTKAIVERESTRAIRVADALEISVSKNGYSGRLHAAHIVLGAGLGLIEARLPVWAWRDGRPCLSAWFETISVRQSFRSTAPPPL